jgi:hypothetical protein
MCAMRAPSICPYCRRAFDPPHSYLFSSNVATIFCPEVPCDEMRFLKPPPKDSRRSEGDRASYFAEAKGIRLVR